MDMGKSTELERYMPLQECWLLMQLSPSARGINIFLSDITESKKQSVLLQLFESVITRSADSTLITSTEPIHLPGPQIIYVNEAFTRMTGYQPEEVIGSTPRVLQGPGTNRKYLDRIKVALLQWKPVEVELLNYRKNKEEFWLSISIVPVSNEKGWFTHWISIQGILRKGSGKRNC
jgi:PAS domain S-box-containing protein